MRFYCKNDMERPRVPPSASGVVVEDPRRRGLFRLRLRRNDAQINSMMPLLALALGANCDGQAVITVKGAADYICKYVTKYGAGQSVSSRIAAILDEIILRVAPDATTTVASVMAKAFIATSVPDQVCSLEAWHLLWGLRRQLCTRHFQSLNLDGLRGVKLPTHMKGGAEGEALEKDAKMTKEMPWERYERREGATLAAGTIGMSGGELAARERLRRCNLWDYVTQYESRGGKLYRKDPPRVLIPKPFLHLDMMRPTAGRTARMALRALKPWGPGEDPCRMEEGEPVVGDDEAIEGLAKFVADDRACPRWFRERYEKNNSSRSRKVRARNEARAGSLRGAGTAEVVAGTEGDAGGGEVRGDGGGAGGPAGST